MPQASAAPVSASISPDMRVSDIAAILPECESLLREYGLTCFSCSMSVYETLREGCASHGFSDADVDQLTVELNEMLADRPARAQTLTVTSAAANALKEILSTQGHLKDYLEVGTDERGGFCMEVREKMIDGALLFGNREVPDVRVIATPLALSRIGGSTIDHRDGRFKLDMPEDAAATGCACKNGGKCGCK